MQAPIAYNADWKRAEQIVLETAKRHSVKTSELSEPALRDLERRYFILRAEIEPKLYFRPTDNWIEMTVRFVAEDHGIRETRNRMSRDILDAFTREAIGIASV